MKRFILKIIVFSIPIGILVLPPFLVLTLSKESYFNLDQAIAANKRYLVGYAYEERNYGYLKWETINQHANKDILALGSSRVLQLRENMFASSFYNAGFAISGISDFKPFLQSIPAAKYPRYLIIGLDQWMFNKAWDDLNPKRPKRDYKTYSKYPSPGVYKHVYADLLSGKIDIGHLLDKDTVLRIGLNAFVNNRGYRNDGSMNYGNQVDKLIRNDSTAADFHYSDTYNRIDKGIRRFQYASSVNTAALPVLDDFLGFCKVNNIYVIGFLPPFADKVFHKMTESGKYGYLKEIYPGIAPVFKKHGFEVYDFSSVTFCDSDDGETIDGFHGGEITYLKMLVKMLESGSQLSQVTNIVKLRQDILHKQNNLIAYK